MYAADLFQQRLSGVRRASREDHNSSPPKAAFHHMAYPLRQGADWDLFLFINLAGWLLFDVRGRQFDLDNVCPELCRDMSCIAAHIDPCFAFLAQARSSRIGPNDNRQARFLRLFSVSSNLAVHLQTMAGTGINGEADADTAKPQRVLHAPSQGLEGVLFVAENVTIIDLQDQGNLSREITRSRFQKSQWRGVGVGARFDRQLEMISRIVRRRIGAEASRRTMLETPIHRQDHQLASAAQPAMIQQPREVGESAWIVA